MHLNEVLQRLPGARRSGNGWVARCPAHDDTNPSLSLTEKDGQLLVFCHAGCPYLEIMAALGASNVGNDRVPGYSNGDQRSTSASQPIRPAGLSPTLIHKTPVAEYDYTDEDGQSLYQVVRIQLAYDDGSTGKKFTARRRPNVGERAEADGWIYNLKGIPLVLYNLTGIVEADLVYVVEGEKDVETLTRAGVAATCNPFGAGKWRSEFNNTLTGKVVAIVPDHDDTGRAHATKVANSLYGIAKELLIVNLPGLPEHGDVTDYFDLGGTVDDLIELVGQAESWKPSEKLLVKENSSGFEFTTLRNLLMEEPEDVSFIWEETLPSGGFSICSAKPKVGKSTLARNLAVSIAAGDTFLGRATVKGRILYLCLEEKRSEIQKHFQKMGASSDDILIHTGSTPKDALGKLAGVIREFSPTLMIIDPLSRVIRVGDFNDYGHMTRGLEPLVDLARQTGCHIMALHHDSKMERTGGDSILGSTALFGSVDCHLQLKKRDKGRTIMTTQRYGEDMPETVIHLENNSGLITELGDLQTFTLDKAKVAILDSVGENEALGQAEIKSRVENFTNGDISRALRSLVEDGQLCRTGEGTRGKAFMYSKPTLWVN